MRQRMMRRLRVFTDRYPLLGPLIYILSIQYFIMQWLVAQRWMTVSYSFSQNVISDLGNTACGQYAGRFVCSPGHALMNYSFIVLGVTMAAGSLLIYTEFKRSPASLAGFVMMGLAGLGTILVGFFPENTVRGLHASGAVLGLGLGNVGLLVLALAIRQARLVFRIYTFVSGGIALAAFAFFVTGNYLGLGQGGMERLASYPQTAWLILFGIYMSATRYRTRRNN